MHVHHTARIVPQRTAQQSRRKSVMKNDPPRPIDTLRSLAIKFPQCPLDHPRARFVHQLESPILRRITVAFVEFRKDFNRRRLRRVIVKPPSLADFPAVIIAVLRTRRSMQVDQHENVIFFRHRKCPIKILNALEIRAIRSQQPVSNRNSHDIDTMFGQPLPIGLGDKRVAMVHEFFDSMFSLHKRMLVNGVAVGKERGRHPFLENQPAAEIYTA